MILSNISRTFDREEWVVLTDLMYDSRSTLKKWLRHLKPHTIKPVVGEFWWYYNWMNIWQEISKPDSNYLRVWLVVSTRTWNGLVMIIPLSTMVQKHTDYIFELPERDKYVPQKCNILINQTKLIDKRRLENKVITQLKEYPRVHINKFLDKYCEIFK